MFQDTYVLFGEELRCVVYQRSTLYRLETDIYTHIKKAASNSEYKYYRLDTTNQMGFPDVALFKKHAYCLIEAKQLKKKRLVSLEDDLEWQFGQVAFAVRALKLGMDYAVAVSKDYELAIIAREDTQCQTLSNLRF